ncbi:hypothetical protein [Bradyrhizobium sp. MOS002]|uniref:hypothetical protein n=1 Tax=Bradyrhizobium sp. MOS002 TaxID=2133947 RepID=UPI0011B25E50|nr:hypothetical protein [Bradyrhizobium sp. MOS002]
MATIAQIMNGTASPNRYFTSDEAKWAGPSHIAPGKRPEKRIGRFVYDGPDDSPIAKLRASYESAIAAVDTLRTKRGETEKSGQFTPLGVTEQLARGAVTDEIPALRRARAAVDKVKADIAERRGSLKLAKPTPEQIEEHKEIRTAMRMMGREQREAFLKEHRTDPTVAAAIVNAIPALSGVDPLIRQHIAHEQLQREHGEALSEIADLEEVALVVDEVTGKARNELREIIGTSREVFESIAKVGEARNGELPMKVEQRLINGQQVEVCRVFDMAAREWRDASADEVGRAA